MTMPLPPESDVLEELSILKKYFKSVHDELRNGQVVDITGFDRRITAVCLAIQKLAPDMQKQCLPELTDFIQQLDNYGEDLRRLKGIPNSDADKS